MFHISIKIDLFFLFCLTFMFYTFKFIMFRKVLVFMFLIFSLSITCWVFWEQELRYSLPTKEPENFKTVRINSVLEFDSLISRNSASPKLLHFFNPTCPCSKFNIKHFHDLHSAHKEDVKFYAVIPQVFGLSDVKEYIPKDVTIILDTGKVIAAECGVFSTPQAALITKLNKLYYRGNYNKSRYCTNPKSNFVQMALDSILINDQKTPIFDDLASIPYGCSIPDSSHETTLLTRIYENFSTRK